MSQLDTILEADLVESSEAVGFFVEPKNIAEPVIKAISIEELKRYGDNIDVEGGNHGGTGESQRRRATHHT